jgi:hypothetical protein
MPSCSECCTVCQGVGQKLRGSAAAAFRPSCVQMPERIPHPNGVLDRRMVRGPEASDMHANMLKETFLRHASAAGAR